MSYPFTLIFLEGAQASWQRRSEAITQDLNSRSSLLPIFLNCKLSKIAVLQEPVWGIAVGKSMSPEDLRKASDQRTQERGPGIPGGDVRGQLAPSFQVWNCNAPLLGRSAIISCSWIFLGPLQAGMFFYLPPFSEILAIKQSLQVLWLLLVFRLEPQFIDKLQESPSGNFQSSCLSHKFWFRQMQPFSKMTYFYHPLLHQYLIVPWSVSSSAKLYMYN